MRSLLILLFLIAPANAQSYLIFSNLAACLARSQAMCQAMGCDGTHTIYWWDCDTGPLSAGFVGPSAVASGSYALRVYQSGFYAATTSNLVSGGAQGLTATEQAKLVTPGQIAALVPTSSTTAVVVAH